MYCKWRQEKLCENKEKTLTPPLPRSLTPIPSPKGEGDFGGGESLAIGYMKVKK